MTETPARLSIVTLGVRDMGVLRSFYRKQGWPELPIGDNSWTGFLLGGVLLALSPMSDLTAEAAPIALLPRGGPASRWPAQWIAGMTSTARSMRPCPPVRLRWPLRPTGRGAGFPRS